MSSTPSTIRRAPRRLRRALVLAHRWVGLGITLFLVIVGTTGSLIAFNDELEAWISPALFRVAPPYPGAPLLDPFELRDRVIARFPDAEVDWVELHLVAERSAAVGLDARPGASQPLPDDQVFVDPYTGRVLGARSQGDLSQGWKNLMPFVNSLHTSLALGDVGAYALGIAALLWTIDCFVGFSLTFPARIVQRAGADPPRRSPARWASRWRPAWLVRWRSSSSKLVFDLHRAGGLWTWVALFVLAWSGVGFNLAPVYQATMGVVTGYVPRGAVPSTAPAAADDIGWTRARRIAAASMSDVAARNGFTVLRERLLHHDRERGLYEYRVLSTLDVGLKAGNTTLFIDAATGALADVRLPTGQHAGNTIETWLSSLHTAAWGGLAMQVVVCVVGVAVVVLSVTGVLIWGRRRNTRATRRSGLQRT